MLVRNLCHKLNDRRGESLVETMIAVLVASLSVAMLFACVKAAGDINSRMEVDKTIVNESGVATTVPAIDSIYYRDLSNAEEQSAVALSTDVTVERATELATSEAPSESATSVSVNVKLYGGEGMYSYGE